MLRDFHTISKLTVLQIQIEKKQYCLLAEKKLNFDLARQIGLVMESADKNVHDIAAFSNTTTFTQPNICCIDRGNSGRRKSKKPFFQCDCKHSPDYCYFRNATCNFCQKTGHILAACLKRKGTKVPEINEYIRSTEMSMTTTHTLLLQETLLQCTNSSASHKKKNLTL